MNCVSVKRHVIDGLLEIDFDGSSQERTCVVDRESGSGLWNGMNANGKHSGCDRSLSEDQQQNMTYAHA